MISMCNTSSIHCKWNCYVFLLMQTLVLYILYDELKDEFYKNNVHHIFGFDNFDWLICFNWCVGEAFNDGVFLVQCVALCSWMSVLWMKSWRSFSKTTRNGASTWTGKAVYGEGLLFKFWVVMSCCLQTLTLGNKIPLFKETTYISQTFISALVLYTSEQDNMCV